MPGERLPRFEVWVDADLCTGGGNCIEEVPELFMFGEDGLCHVYEKDKVLDAPSTVIVPPDLETRIIHAAEECPGEIIFLERR